MAFKGAGLSLEGITQVDTEKRFALGEYLFRGSRTYVYVQGVTSGAAGKAVTFTSAGVTTLTVADANGPVGILMAALDATTKYGFVQVFGICSTVDVTTATAGEAVYTTATPGRLDSTAVTGDMVHGATTLVTGASNVATMFLNYPHCIDSVI